MYFGNLKIEQPNEIEEEKYFKEKIHQLNLLQLTMMDKPRDGGRVSTNDDNVARIFFFQIPNNRI